MTREEFQTIIQDVTNELSGRPVDAALRDQLSREFPADGEWVSKVRAACGAAIKAGWMCKHEQGGIKFGRVLKPSDELSGFSVDVVHMEDVAGPHHTHPNGEIDLVMPLTDGALFDGHGPGWVVYEAGSSHSPTLTNGTALVLYLLPGGAIEFS